MAPRAVPTAQEITKASIKLSTPSAIRLLTAIYWPVIAITGKDISIPPASNPTKKATARMAIPELLFIRSNMFSTVRKTGLIG